PDMPLLRTPITVEDDAWLAADSFVGPGVVVGKGAILGARGVAMTSLEGGWIYAGNPAVKVKPRGAQDQSSKLAVQGSNSEAEREAGDWE
ncbi:MAG TPA: hypothetical protein VFF65_03470, partial [Phycisphaerales bacterium]|nr:hypothetical protein [Phycisphaerales bacterium]